MAAAKPSALAPNSIGDTLEVILIGVELFEHAPEQVAPTVIGVMEVVVPTSDQPELLKVYGCCEMVTG